MREPETQLRCKADGTRMVAGGNGRGRRLSLEQRMFIRSVVKASHLPKGVIYAQLAQLLKVSARTIERTVRG